MHELLGGDSFPILQDHDVAIIAALSQAFEDFSIDEFEERNDQRDYLWRAALIVSLMYSTLEEVVTLQALLFQTVFSDEQFEEIEEITVDLFRGPILVNQVPTDITELTPHHMKLYLQLVYEELLSKIERDAIEVSELLFIAAEQDYPQFWINKVQDKINQLDPIMTSIKEIRGEIFLRDRRFTALISQLSDESE